MTRHGGFAVAATVDEAYLNQKLWAAIADQEPLSFSRLFSLPTAVPVVGGGTARLTGVAFLEERPTLHLQANPANTVNVTTSAVVYVAANTDLAGPVDLDQTWKVRLSADADVGVDVEVASEGLFLRWLPGGSSVNNITVTVLEGSGIPQFVVDALRSPAIRAAMNTALRGFGPIRLSERLFPRNLEHTQAGKFPEANFSVFEWFTIRASISRVAVRVLDGAVALGIDFAGLSAGQDASLIDLGQQVGEGAVYKWPRSSDRPILIPCGPKTHRFDIAVLVNSDVLTGIVADVSRQISGTPIRPDIKIISVSMRPRLFDKPLRGRELGLCFEFTVRHRIAGDINGRIFLQPFLVTEGSEDTVAVPDWWAIYVGKAEIDVPWWVDIMVAVVGLGLTMAFPMVEPLVALGAGVVIGDILPSVVSNTEAKAELALGQGMSLAAGYHFESSRQSTITGTVTTGTGRIKVSPDGIDLGMIDVANRLRFGSATELEFGSITASLAGGSPEPYVFSVGLSNTMAGLADDCSVQLIVRRADTGAEVARSEGPYHTHRTLTLDHLTPELYLVDQYQVQARIFLNRASLTGLLFGVNDVLKVKDFLDRHHSFVTWPPYTARFLDPSRNFLWRREVKPKLHRTASSARCLALRQRIERAEKKQAELRMVYVDDLGFPFSELGAHRAEVCSYCFWGYPNRDANHYFPQSNWFKK
ncbi:hypothetical protein ABZ865_41635 [Streptomyces sp. NPDC047085]|uniref:hypothetical protein n=1 Tax=Streptomyces sp. NPDC047085 TaxID=3155140 RepID=UPI0033E83AF2